MYKFATITVCGRLLIVSRERTSVNLAHLTVIIGTGFVLRVLALLNNAAIEIDGIQYATAGEAFATGRFGDALNNVFSPGYPLFIGLFHLVVPDLELAARMVSVFFGTMVIWLSFSFGKKMLKDSDKALWLSFLVAFHPYLIRYSGEALSESLATFLFTLTVFLFYLGWQENRRFLVALSGLCLAFTYLTRPEYIIYYVPLTLLLLWKKRLVDSLTLLLPILILGSLYMLYLHGRTGLWVISNKALLSPFVSPSVFVTNIPAVSLSFLLALSPLFFILVFFGILKAGVSYRNLLIVLITFHIVSLAFISHSTKRYSVEFIPLCMICAAEGVGLTAGWFSRLLSRRLAQQLMVTLVVIVSLLAAYTQFRQERFLQKKAGIFLSSHDPGSIIAARLPIAAFYAKGTSVDLLSLTVEGSPERLDRILQERKVKYLVLEDKGLEEMPFLADYVSSWSPILALGDERTFVRVYRLY